MYAVFDEFLEHPWSGYHLLDQRRFYIALGEVVRNPVFDAENLRNYFTARILADRFSDTTRLNEARDHYVGLAKIVRQFFEVNGEIER